MFNPGFRFFWNHVSNDWIVSEAAALLFGIASVIVVALTSILLSNAKIETSSLVLNSFWALIGIAGGLSIFFVWSGMWQYWLRCDTSTKAARRAWFLVLIVGFWYGAIVYYLLGYLPQRHRASKVAT